MLDSKYSKFLNILLIIVIIAIVGLLGYLGFDLFKKIMTQNEAEKFSQQYEEDVIGNNKEENTEYTEPIYEEETNQNNGKKKYKYKGYDVGGTIEIPKTKIKYPVLEKVSKKGLETSVCIQYGVGLNLPGNTVIVGHNFRNGTFFSDNKKLSNGDSIYITDNAGQKLKYIIYNKYETTPEDTDYMLRNTEGKREISLSTCTDDSTKRTVIWAVAETDK